MSVRQGTANSTLIVFWLVSSSKNSSEALWARIKNLHSLNDKFLEEFNKRGRIFIIFYITMNIYLKNKSEIKPGSKIGTIETRSVPE